MKALLEILLPIAVIAAIVMTLSCYTETNPNPYPPTYLEVINESTYSAQLYYVDPSGLLNRLGWKLSPGERAKVRVPEHLADTWVVFAVQFTGGLLIGERAGVQVVPTSYPIPRGYTIEFKILDPAGLTGPTGRTT